MVGVIEFLSFCRNAFAIRFVQDIKYINDQSAIRHTSPRCEQDRLSRRGRTSAGPSRPARSAPPLRGLAPERLEEALASMLDRRQERTERRREHIAELNKRAAEADLRLKRLYDAIETGVADLNDPGLKERLARLKAIRDQSQADAMRAQVALESAAQQPITTTMLRKFAATARQRMRIDGGGHRRDHLRALAQRVEVADREVRIMGSKSDLLRTLAAISGVKSATGGVRSSVPNRRSERDSNYRYDYPCLTPLPSQLRRAQPRRFRCDFPPVASTTLPRTKFRLKFGQQKSPRKHHVFKGLELGCGDRI